MGLGQVAVLVITTVPDRAMTARVVSTQDVSSGLDTTVVVTTLAELVSEVEAWWSVYWRPEGDITRAGDHPS